MLKGIRTLVSALVFFPFDKDVDSDVSTTFCSNASNPPGPLWMKCENFDLWLLFPLSLLGMQLWRWDSTGVDRTQSGHTVDRPRPGQRTAQKGGQHEPNPDEGTRLQLLTSSHRSLIIICPLAERVDHNSRGKVFEWHESSKRAIAEHMIVHCENYTASWWVSLQANIVHQLAGKESVGGVWMCISQNVQIPRNISAPS